MSDMVICKKHWRELRQALIKRGLGPWLADDANLLDQRANYHPETPEGFEPLLDAMKEIRYTAYFYAVLSGQQGCCGLCVLDELRKGCTCETCRDGTGLTWIQAFVEHEYSRAQKLQLVAQPS